jgi:hypothetical protein
VGACGLPVDAAPPQLRRDELPRDRVDRPRIELRIRVREITEQRDERVDGAGQDRRELVGEVGLQPRSLGEQHLRAPRLARIEPEPEHRVDPRLQLGACVRRGRDACVDVGVAALRFLLVDGEHEFVLRAEVPVEGARREPGLGEHLGNRQARRAPPAQHREAGLDERAHLVLGPPPLVLHRTRRRPLRNRHSRQ